MGWFDEQIKERKNKDEEVFQESFYRVADAVMGSRMAAALGDLRVSSKDAIAEILKYYHAKAVELPGSVTDVNEQLEYLLRPYGIMRREVRLEKGWYQDAAGAMLAQFREGGQVVALIPSGFMGYTYLDVNTGKRVKITAQNEGLFDPDALCFYKPFPLKKLTIPDLMRYILTVLGPADYASIVLGTAAVTAVGWLMPWLNRVLMSDVLDSRSVNLLISMTITIIFVTLGTTLLNTVKSMLSFRVSTKMNIAIDSATMMRILSLPAAFFKDYSSGELASRLEYMKSLCNMLVDTLLNTTLTSVFSLTYILQIFQFTPALVTPALVVIIVTVVYSVLSSLMQMKLSKEQMQLSTKESGMNFAMISGIQKIRLSGSEKRMFSRWADLYAKVSKLQYDPPLFIKLNSVIGMIISLGGTLAIYSAAIASKINFADYYAFNTAYAMVSGAFMQLAGIALTVAQIKPTLDMVKPIMEAVPEVSEGKKVLERISGGIELSHVSFRYGENLPMVIDDMSLKISAGQYVAIVGTTGCGKSTLMRLLLGFEKPLKGAIYYDGKDMDTIDLRSLRRKIGSVMQNGGLLSGDIFANITISAPWLTLDDAWAAAEIAGMADDIRRMPMGMFTLISEGQGGISGGQKQRLMIARAVAPKPRILMFDEATSALDNLTQKKVSEALDKLKCTRIVIAHRLSTIRHCDRIIVLDKGKIIEDGTYDQLIAKNGFFAELVERQRLDVQ